MTKKMPKQQHERNYTRLRVSRRDFLKGAAATAVASSMVGTVFAQRSGKTFAYVGTYTGAIGNGGNGEGIYLFELNPSTGALTKIKLAAETASPSWLAIDPAGKYLYAANEIQNYQGKNGSVSAYAIDRSSGDLKLLNVVSSQGAGPAHLSVDHAGKYVFVANYFGGSIAVLPIQADGSLGAPTDVHQDSGAIGSTKATNAPEGSFAISGHDIPHAHMIQVSPDNKFVLHTDLAQDRIYIYRLDSQSGKLTPAATPFASLPSGDGPRHFTFHPNGRWMYSLQEESSTLAFFHYDPATGALEQKQTLSSLPKGFKGSNFTSEIMLSPDGRHLYAANRLHDSVSIFNIGSDGMLTFIADVSTLGDYPRHFNFDPAGKFFYVCNQKSDAIVCFRLQKETGLLTPTGEYTSVGSPSAIVFVS